MEPWLIIVFAVTGVLILGSINWVVILTRNYLRNTPYPTEGTPTQRWNEWSNKAQDFVSGNMTKQRIPLILTITLVSVILLTWIAVLLAVLENRG